MRVSGEKQNAPAARCSLMFRTPARRESSTRFSAVRPAGADQRKKSTAACTGIKRLTEMGGRSRWRARGARLGIQFVFSDANSARLARPRKPTGGSISTTCARRHFWSWINALNCHWSPECLRAPSPFAFGSSGHEAVTWRVRSGPTSRCWISACRNGWLHFDCHPGDTGFGIAASHRGD